MSTDKSQTMPLTRIEIHQATSGLLAKIVGLVVVMLGLWWFRSLVSSVVKSVFGSTLLSDSTWFLLGLLAFALTVVYLVFQWQSLKYVLTPTKVVYYRGILVKNSRAVDVKVYVSANMTQGIVGRLLGYGTIVFNANMQGMGDSLDNIPNPEIYAREISQLISGEPVEIEQEMLEENWKDDPVKVAAVGSVVNEPEQKKDEDSKIEGVITF